MRAISQDENWIDWRVFFPEALKEQVDATIGKANVIVDLYEELMVAIPKIVNSQYLIQTLDGIFRTAIFTGSGFTQATHIERHSETHTPHACSKLHIGDH